MHVAWKFAALLITALSLGPSFAHVLEAPPRLEAWPPQLWIDATVFHGQYVVFGALGAPLDGGAMNSIMATWRPGDIPANFESVRNRWEFGHMAIAALKLAGFVAVIVAVLKPSR